MTERRRTPLLLAPLLALTVRAAVGWAYVAFGPSGGPDDIRATGSGTVQQKVVLQASASKSTGSDTTPNGNANGLPKDFGVRLASIDSLFPGASRPLRMTFTNPESFEIQVTKVVVAATSTAAGCPSTHLVTGTYALDPAVLVPRKNGTASTMLPFGMKATAPDACQAKSFTVTVTASGVKP